MTPMTMREKIVASKPPATAPAESALETAGKSESERERNGREITDRVTHFTILL